MDIILRGLTILFARILDVSIGTIKTMTLVQNRVILSSILAFLEVLIWYLVARAALIDGSLVIGIFYALGYATGTLIGCIINKYVVSRKIK